MQHDGWGSCRDLGFLPQSNSDVAADLGERLEERVAEGVDAEGVDAADALDLDQVALDAGHHCPDVAEGDEGKEEAPDHGQGDSQDGRKQPVAPVLADGEGGVAGFPDTVKAVRSHWLSYHVFKIHLGAEKRQRVSADCSGRPGSCCHVGGEPGGGAGSQPPEQRQTPVCQEAVPKSKGDAAGPAALTLRTMLTGAGAGHECSEPVMCVDVFTLEEARARSYPFLAFRHGLPARQEGGLC